MPQVLDSAICSNCQENLAQLAPIPWTCNRSDLCPSCFRNRESYICLKCMAKIPADNCPCSSCLLETCPSLSICQGCLSVVLFAQDTQNYANPSEEDD